MAVLSDREPTLTLNEPFRATRDGDEPWVMLATGDQTGGAVAFGEARLPPETTGPSFHVHQNEDEAAYIVSGVMTFRVGDDEFEAGPGTLVWLPRRVPHTFANRSLETVVAFGTVTPAGLEGMFAEQAAHFAGLDGPPDEARAAEIGARYGVTQ